MELALAAVSVLAVFSVAFNVIIYLRYRGLRKSPQPTLEAQQLLHDLTTKGGAVLRVEVIDPAGLLYWKGGV